MNANNIDAFFNQTFDRVQTTLEFNPNWANGTGYLDHAAEGPDAPVLAAGEMAKSTDNFGRRVIIIGTPAGNLVVFRRYTKEDGIYTYNSSRGFDQYWMGTFCQGKQTLEELKTFFGEGQEDNVGALMSYQLNSGLSYLQKRSSIHMLPDTAEPLTGIARKHVVSQNKTETMSSVTTNLVAAARVVEARMNLQAFIDENLPAEKRNEMCALVAAYTEASENYFTAIKAS